MIISIYLERDTGVQSDGRTAGGQHLPPEEILLFPVRTLRGGFAWVGSDKRLRAALASVMSQDVLAELMTVVEEALCRASCVTSTRSGVIHGQTGGQDRIVLEQFALTAERHLMIDRLGAAFSRFFFPTAYELSWWSDKIAHDLAIVREEHFVRLLESIEGPGFAPGVRRINRIPGDTVLIAPAERFSADLLEAGGEGAAVFQNDRRPPSIARLRSVSQVELPEVAERERRGKKTADAAGSDEQTLGGQADENAPAALAENIDAAAAPGQPSNQTDLR